MQDHWLTVWVALIAVKFDKRHVSSQIQVFEMEALYHATNRLIQETQECFQQLERNPTDTKSIEDEIQAKITAVNRYAIW